MATLIRFKRGPEEALLTSGVTLSAAEPAFTTDTFKLYIGGDNTGQNKIEVGNRNIPNITTLVNKSSAYLPNITTPQATDFVSLTSYGNTFQGILYSAVVGGTNVDITKWGLLVEQNTSMLMLTLCSAKFFNKPLDPSKFPAPLIVTAEGGQGTEAAAFDRFVNNIFVPSSYCRYINNILRTNNQFTVLSGSAVGAKGSAVIAKRCLYDDFYLEFEERLVNMSLNDVRFRSRYLYSLKTVDGNGLEDSFGGDFTDTMGRVILSADDAIHLYKPASTLAGTFVNIFARWKKTKPTIGTQ
jgi:hypothetical protein